MNKELIVIQGPTAIGKTDIAIKIANRYNSEIISADSRQFYKELKIGTCPPSKSQLLEIKHHFIHHISIKENYNIYNFEKDAIHKISDLFKTHNKIIMVGGSGLYIDSVCNGVDKIDDVPKELRKKIINKYNNHGIRYLQKEIKLKDPKLYKEIDLKNPQRLIRALEVINYTRTPFSSFRKNKKKKRNFNIKRINLSMPRERLYKRINDRVDIMIKNGLLNEVNELISYKKKNALQTIGYKEIFNVINGEDQLEEAIEKIKRNTRRFAKRQMTWFKKTNPLITVDPEKISEIIKVIE